MISFLSKLCTVVSTHEAFVEHFRVPLVSFVFCAKTAQHLVDGVKKRRSRPSSPSPLLIKTRERSTSSSDTTIGRRSRPRFLIRPRRASCELFYHCSFIVFILPWLTSCRLLRERDGSSLPALFVGDLVPSSSGPLRPITWFQLNSFVGFNCRDPGLNRPRSCQRAILLSSSFFLYCWLFICPSQSKRNTECLPLDLCLFLSLVRYIALLTSRPTGQ